jgi:ATP-dependent helicase HrpB
MKITLPIHEVKETFLRSFHQGSRLLVKAPTGSGKSTQIPQWIADHSDDQTKKVLVLQPRRLPARMLAKRVAQEREVELGTEVGYRIRLENRTTRQTRIEYLTEGILTRQMMGDPDLKGVGTLVFDEFHERHLEGDVALAMAMEIQEHRRPDLKIVVMSATLETKRLQEYLSRDGVLAPVIESEGRAYPVEMRYHPRALEEREGLFEETASVCESLMREQTEGDVLIFMPGSYEIQKTIRLLEDRVRGAVILPLHGELPPDQQDAAIQSYPKRKIIVSTNVAETSLTIDGVRIVIDSGWARVAAYDSNRGINTLIVQKISRASADQRAGRAGRTAPGVCYRLWSVRDHEGRAAQELPEVKRLELSEVVLNLKSHGIVDLKTFRWMEAPEERSLVRAENLLKSLGALDSRTGEMTELGKRMTAFPAHPRYSRMLIEADRLGCVRSVCLIAVLTQTRNLLMRPMDKKQAELRKDILGEDHLSDFFLWMRAWRYAEGCRYDMGKCRSLGIHVQSARTIMPMLQQFLKIAEDQGMDISEKPASDESIRRSVLSGFSDQLAVRLDGGTLRCAVSGGRRGVISQDSGVQQARVVVATEIQEVEGKEKDLTVRLSGVTAVSESWLMEMGGDRFAHGKRLVWDPMLKKVLSETYMQFDDLVLESKKRDTVPSSEAASLLADSVLNEGLPLKAWDDRVDQWIVRIHCFSKWCPELGIKAFEPEDRNLMVHQLCEGAMSYKEVKDREIWPVLETWLSHEQRRQFEKEIPERKELPGGRKAKIEYFTDRPPVLSATIQALYGVEEDLLIAWGRIPLLIEILAPNQRPVQVTKSLKTFWKETYPTLKLELARKYPKHEWR